MVQKKVPNKHGIQPDEVNKPEKLLGNLKKPSFCQHHMDGKNRGPDMKKKMKRSGSIKPNEGLKLTPLKKTIAQPGKPPPLDAPAAAAAVAATTPLKQSLIRTTDGTSPNYMKSTSSSEARKERSPVSSVNTQSGSDIKNLRRRSTGNSNLSSGSCNKQPKTLTRTSSFKLVRTLTKSPSFKPVRGTAKKCSRVALCADMNIQRATCSSTLKDLKFPSYLMLNPGGTEAEGTSVMKVCPYAYCSLNGHHHTPLPPLKCFLKARRRSLKAQKSAKLEILSPCRSKAYGDGTEDIDGHLGFGDDNILAEDVETVGLVKIPMIHEVGTDFFVEIYAKNTEYGAEATARSTDDEPNEDNKIQSDESQHSEIDFEGNFEPNSCTNSAEMDVTGENLKEYQAGYADEEETTILPREEASVVSNHNGGDVEGEYHASTGDCDSICEATDMEWEEGQFPTSEDETEADHLHKHDDDSQANVEYLLEIKKLDWPDHTEIIRPDDTASNCTDEILVDDVLKELSEEETASFNMECNSESELDGMAQNSEIPEPPQVSCGLYYHEFDGSAGLTAMGDEGKEVETGLIDVVETSTSKEEPIMVTTEVDENIETENDVFESIPQLGGDQNDCNAEIDAETWNSRTSLQADIATMGIQNQIDGCSQNFDDQGLVKTDEDFNENQKNTGAEIDEDLETSVASLHQEHSTNKEAGDAIEDQEQVANPEVFSETQVSDSSRSFSEDDQDDAEVNSSENDIATEVYQLNDDADDSRSNQDIVDENVMAATDVQELEKDDGEANKFESSTSKDFEEQSDSSMYEINSAGNNEAEVEKMEVEVCTKSDTEETFVATNTGTSVGSECAFVHPRSNFNREVPSTCTNRKWSINRGKKPTMDLEEQRKFNPKEPNFLPVVQDPEAEKVDLRHQMMDDRKDAEEWMLDYALRKAVNKLAPARKRKVALLVEAFETVLPIPKYEPHIRHASADFSPRPIQACS